MLGFFPVSRSHSFDLAIYFDENQIILWPEPSKARPELGLYHTSSI